MSATESGPSDTVQVYTPFRRGVPALGAYLQDLRGRWPFALELARSELRTANVGTGLGQFWLIMNPLLLTFVYYLLVSVVGHKNGGAAYLAHIMAGLFIFYFFSGSVVGGASSILSSGRLILNTAFPKMLLPLSVVLVNFLRFLPTLVIYAVVHAVAGLSVSPVLLWAVVPLASMVLLATGLSMVFATLNVYFRDTKSFLPYAMRIWMYLSPVLYFPHQLTGNYRIIADLNPLFPVIGSWSEIVVQGNFPGVSMLLRSILCGVVGFLLGAYVLMSREREFAVRL